MAKEKKEEVVILRNCIDCFWSVKNINDLHCILRMKDENIYLNTSKVKESKCYYFRYKLKDKV